MKEVAQCCILGCADIAVSVRRIAEVVAEHTGGPVIDANVMFTRWLGKSMEQRTSHQTSLLPIGRIDIGLSRHRALLFKILADTVGIPCKLFKGSHYTGAEDDAINIIKMGNDMEYLVDVMAAPGTLIPAFFFNSKGTSLKPHQTLIQNQVSDSVINMDNEPFALHSECKHNQLHMPSNINWASGNYSGYEMTTVSSVQDPWAVTLPVTEGYSASAPCALTTKQPSDQTLSAGALSKQKEDMELLPYPQDNESKKIFSGLNPSRAVGSGKSSVALKRLDNRNNEFQRRRENVAPVPARPQQPLVIKNWSAFNDISNNKQYNFAEGLVSRRNTVDNAPSSSQVGWSSVPHCNSNAVEHNNKSHVAPVCKYNNGTIVSSDVTTASTSREYLDGSNMGAASNYDMIGTLSVNTGCVYGFDSVEEKGPCDDVEKGPMHSISDSQLSVNADGFALQVNENKENMASLTTNSYILIQGSVPLKDSWVHQSSTRGLFLHLKLGQGLA